MNSLKRLLFIAIAGTLCLSQVASADDTEIFMAPPPLTGNAGNPNVLIIIDNSANWDANSPMNPSPIFWRRPNGASCTSSASRGKNHRLILHPWVLP